MFTQSPVRRIVGIALMLSLSGMLASCSLPALDFSQKAVPNPVDNAPFESALDTPWFEGQILIGYEDNASLTRVARSLNANVTNKIDEIRAARLELPNGVSVEQALNELRSSQPQGLRFAEPNYIRTLVKPDVVEDLEIDDFEAQSVTGQQSSPYNDPLQNRQWALDAMDVSSAWSRATGVGSVIGVVDTGLDGTHPELFGKQVTGMSCKDGEFIAPNEDSTQESNTHATHVAGIAAARGNNNFGIVGIAPDAQIMALRIFDADLEEPGNGSGYVGDDNVANCIIWAATLGGDGIPNTGDEADVLNNSWGGRGYGQVLKEAVDKVTEAGVLFVNSMGNSAADEALSPKVYPGVMGVGATTPHDTRTGFSTMGSVISVGAPGDDVLSSVPTWLMRPDGEPYNFQYFDGTSMAAPQVSGAIALILEVFPDATPYQVRKILEMTADDIEEKGFDRLTGYGRINLSRALSVGSLPADGAAIGVNVETTNLGDTNEDGVIDENDSPVGVGYMDVILRDSTGVDRYYAQTNAEGVAEFFAIEPGEYDVLVAGGDVVIHTFRAANRVTSRANTNAPSGQKTDVDVRVNTTLNVSISWPENVDLDLQVAEPRVGATPEWVSASSQVTSAEWGVFSSGTGRIGYSLSAGHYPNALYELAINAENAAGAATVTVTIEQNGVVETYGPLTVQPGEVLPSSQWEGLWENFPDPERGFEEAGPGGPWVY